MILWMLFLAVAITIYVLFQIIGPLPPGWDQKVTDAVMVVLVWGGFILLDRIQKLERRIENLSATLSQLREQQGRR